MGTRALIHIKEEGKTLVTIYRQYDGYPTGLGLDIAHILQGSSLVNGYETNDEAPTKFNGVGCMAAFLISKLKQKIGNVYIYPIDSQNVGEEFTYTLSEYKGRPHLKIRPNFKNSHASSFDLSDMGTLDDIKAYQRDLFKEEN